MRRRPLETDFSINENFVEVRFASAGSCCSFIRLTDERDFAEFGPLLLEPVIQQASRAPGICTYDAADALARAFWLAMAAARART
jgi:hypothetical protein